MFWALEYCFVGCIKAAARETAQDQPMMHSLVGSRRSGRPCALTLTRVAIATHGTECVIDHGEAVVFGGAAELELAVAGKYREKAMDFLQSHWQAAALKSLADVKVLIPCLLVAVTRCFWLAATCSCVVLRLRGRLRHVTRHGSQAHPAPHSHA